MQDLITKTRTEQEDSSETVKKLFILGAYRAGKKTFLDQVKAIQSNLQRNSELSTRIFEVVLENIEVLKEKCYDDLLQCKQCEVNNRCITQAQGFIIIFDNSRNKSTRKVQDQYRKIAKEICKLNPQKDIPVLLIGNKFNEHNGLNSTALSNEWKEKQGKECSIITKHIEVDLKNDRDSLQRSFQWLIKQMI
jgi:GTPase SAR1 family protein